MHHNIHFQFPPLASRVILHEGINGFLRHGNAVVLGVLLGDGPWVHIQSTYSSQDQISYMHEFSLVHKIDEFDHESNEYVDLV